VTAVTADVIVIGAGVIGSSIARELTRAGLRVVVIDKADSPGRGSTSASSAIVRFNFSTWAAVAAAWEAKACWTEWADHLALGGGADQLARFTRTGIAMLDADIIPSAGYLALFDRAGIPYEEWDPDQLAARMPGLHPGRYWPPKRVTDPGFWDEPSGRLGALYTPDAGYVSDPQLAAANLAAAAARHGAQFLFNTTVTALDRRSDRIAGVQLGDGTAVSAPIVVNAAGPWSGKLNALAGVGDDFNVTVRPLRQEVHYVAAPSAYTRLPVFADVDLGIYVRPEAGGGLLIGGTEPEGVYDVASDWSPIYDKTGLPGYYVAIGTSGNQFKNAPVVGQFLASIIVQTENGADHDTQPVIFTAPHTGHEIDLSAFSRLRKPSDNSGTVLG
jgi:glycine/D-amino acid oxidase-like deaminating enzyme